MSKHKLLLADDSITIQKVVNLTFADEGIEVISVGDGTSAMEKFVESTPDLVMVDVNMPGVDGYRICELIKQDEATKDVPVILLVGSFEPFDEEEARRVGANDYLTKPFQSIRQLVSKVTVLLNKSNGQAASAKSAPVADSTPAPGFGQPTTIEPVSLELGDAGMDDEMIQTDQFAAMQQDSELPERMAEESAEFASQPSVETGDNEQTSDDQMQDYGTNVLTDDVSEDRSAYLEEQMISEFESPIPEEKVFGGLDSPRITSPEEYFAPKEAGGEQSLDPGENSSETDSAYDAVPSDQDTAAVSGETSEPENLASAYSGLPEIAEPDLPGNVQEISVEAETEEAPPSGFDEPETFADSAEVTEQPAPESVAAPDVPATADDQATGVPGAGESLEGEDQNAVAGEDSNLDGGYHAAPVFEESPPDSEPVSEVEERIEDATVYAETAEQPDVVDASAQFSDQFEDSTSDVPQESGTIGESFEPSGLTDSVSEEDKETAWFEERADFREEPVLEEAPADSSYEAAESVDEETGDVNVDDSSAGGDEEIKSLVSNKDRTTDAVESVIVSEFARHSISLSSEAVETIAARIAEKISEKIVQEMAAEVVSDLADLIVEKMERKRQQE